MVDILALVMLLGSTAFAITYLVRYTDGPGDVFLRFRAYVGLEIPVYDGDEDPADTIVDYLEALHPEGFAAKLVQCFWCFTTWITFGVVISAYILGIVDDPRLFPFLWFSGIALSGLINQFCQ